MRKFVSLLVMTTILTATSDKAKKEDEKNINQLYKDLMNGGLRKRAGRDAFDMSDSEDEAEMKQRKKRADFQRMRKALLGDENIGKIAENPKQQAFFKTLADFADDVDYDFLDMPMDPVGLDALQSQSQSQSQSQEGVEGEEVVPDSQTLDSAAMPAPPNPLKRKSPSSQKENRPPPQARRTAASDSMTRKPITLEDVQHSVSELLDDPRVMVPDSQYLSDSDEADDQPVRTTRKAIVDRLTLSRQSTIETSAADSGLAFHAPARTSTGPSFRIPSLMRQATSNLSTASERSSSTAGQSKAESGVRRGGTGRSNIHAQAREAERRAVLEKKESRRKEALKRKVDVGRKSGMRSVLGDLGGGFE
jgi:mediator of replication checkpoint protein 1